MTPFLTFQCIFTLFSASTGPLWGRFWPFFRLFWAFWGFLGGTPVNFWPFLDHFWTFLVHFWAIFGPVFVTTSNDIQFQSTQPKIHPAPQSSFSKGYGSKKIAVDKHNFGCDHPKKFGWSCDHPNKFGVDETRSTIFFLIFFNIFYEKENITRIYSSGARKPLWGAPLSGP